MPIMVMKERHGRRLPSRNAGRASGTRSGASVLYTHIHIPRSRYTRGECDARLALIGELDQ